MKIFAPPNGSEAFEAISGPAGQGLHPDGTERLVASGLDPENAKTMTFTRVYGSCCYGIIVKQTYFLCFFILLKCDAPETL